MEKAVEYLRRANEAQKWADQARSDKAKAAWLRIAQNWLGLVREFPVGREPFEPPAERPATRPDDSTASP
jgi:hypothetical protein